MVFLEKYLTYVYGKAEYSEKTTKNVNCVFPKCWSFWCRPMDPSHHPASKITPQTRRSSCARTHLQGIDFDEFLGAVHDLEVAVFVVVTDVAGVQPTVGVDGLSSGGFVVVIVLHHLGGRDGNCWSCYCCWISLIALSLITFGIQRLFMMVLAEILLIALLLIDIADRYFWPYYCWLRLDQLCRYTGSGKDGRDSATICFWKGKFSSMAGSQLFMAG